MIGSPNLIAEFALFLWAPAVIFLYWRLPGTLATGITLLSGVLFLPELIEFDLPVLPPMNKQTVTALWALLACLLIGRHRKRLMEARPFRGVDLFFVLFFLGSIGTVLTNGDPIRTGPVIRPGLEAYDIVAGGVKDALSIYIPFFLARAMFRSSHELRIFTRVMIAIGLAYAVGALIEVRMSPQLHRWTYGFHPGDFSMTHRGGGYRPTLYLQSGLAVAMFILSNAILATLRARVGLAKPWLAAFLWVALALCKSTGAAVYGLATLPVVVFTKRHRLLLPLGLAALVVVYPALRGAGLFPSEFLVDLAHEYVSSERALSLGFRFDQEDLLLGRAAEKIVFGWGAYSRNRVFHERTGEDISVTDGEWIIIMGARGIVGFIGFFGLLLWPLVRVKRLLPELDRKNRLLISGVSLIVAINVVDLLPNGLFTYLPLFYAGALAGITEGVTVEVRKRKASPPRKKGTGHAIVQGANKGSLNRSA